MQEQDPSQAADHVDRERRGALFAGASAAFLAFAPLVAKAAETNAVGPAMGPTAATNVSASNDTVVPIEDEPFHHPVMDNGQMRVFRVMFQPGQATMWHAQSLDWVNTIIRGSRTTIARKNEGAAKVVDMVTGTVRYGDYQTNPIVDQVTNIGTSLIHQVAFEIVPPSRGNYGSADRTHATSFTVVLDKPRVRGWRLKLAPGEISAPYRQDGPGLRVVLAGARLIEKSPGQLGEQMSLRPGDAMYTTPGLKTLVNASEEPLELMEYELL